MAHKLGNITFYADNPHDLSAFWAEALGYDLQEFDDEFTAVLLEGGLPEDALDKRGLVTPPPGVGGPRLFFHHASGPKSGRNRIHLDIQAVVGGDATAEQLEAERDRLLGLGATVVRLVEQDWGPFRERYYQMRDPEGNEFCLQG
jgi:hypothetical protein